MHQLSGAPDQASEPCGSRNTSTQSVICEVNYAEIYAQYKYFNSKSRNLVDACPARTAVGLGTQRLNRILWDLKCFPVEEVGAL